MKTQKIKKEGRNNNFKNEIKNEGTSEQTKGKGRKKKNHTQKLRCFGC